MRTLALSMMLALTLALLVNCSDDTTTNTDKSPEEYKKEATQQINEQNMNEELKKIEDEINAPDSDLPST